MNIIYCEKCGVRIPDADVTSGAASSADEGRYFCSGCAAAKAPPKAPPSVHSRRDSTSVIPAPAKTRVLSAPKEPRKTMGTAGIVGGIAAIALLGIVCLLLSGGKPPSPPKPEPKKPLHPPPDPLKNSTAGNTTTSPEQSGGERKPPEDEDTPRDMVARRELEALKAWGKEHPDDVHTYADRLTVFAAQNRTTKSGPEAARLLTELKVLSRTGSPVAHWTFDDGSGTSARDSAGTQTAALKGQVRFVKGRMGSGAVAFPGGREDCVDLGSDPKLNFGAGAPFTIAAWFRTSEPFAMLVSFRNSTDSTTDLDIAIGHHGAARIPGRLMAIVRQDGGGARFANIVGKPVNDGVWHHFALTRTSDGAVRLYVDGELQGMQTNAESGGAITTNRRSCGLELLWTQTDKPPDGTGQGLKGEMDDLRVYHCALTGTEIGELANAK